MSDRLAAIQKRLDNRYYYAGRKEFENHAPDDLRVLLAIAKAAQELVAHVEPSQGSLTPRFLDLRVALGLLDQDTESR